MTRRIVGKVFAQDSLEGFAAENAVDGKKDSYWKAQPYFQWWLMDCESVYKVESVRLKTGLSEGQHCRFAIDYSVDRINWKELCVKDDESEEGPGGFFYACNLVARYIRITFMYVKDSETVSLKDVEVLGEKIESYKPRRLSLVDKRIRAVESNVSEGFTKLPTGELEHDWTDQMMLAMEKDSYLVYRAVDLTRIDDKQLRGLFYLPSKNRDFHVLVELRLDSPQGEPIASMDLSRQYTPWVEFAGDIRDGDYGVRDVYFLISHIDKPQQLGVLWLAIQSRPKLETRIIDSALEKATETGNYQVFFGNLHCHTGFSDGVRTPACAYDYARDKAKLDFLAITEHSNLFDDSFDASKSRKWMELKRMADDKTVDDRFIAMMGSETTWYNQFGHMNIYGADFFLNPYEIRYNDTNAYYKTLKQFPDVINQWNHPWSCGARHLDMFEPYDPELDKVMYTIELNSIEVKEENSLMYYTHALDLGWHVSPVGSQDNHKEDWGTENDIRTGIIARRLTKADLYDAIRKHRTYYSSAKDLRVIFYANNALMGSYLSQSNQINFDVWIQNKETDEELSYLEVRGYKGKVFHRQELSGHETRLEFSILNQSPYYFLKIGQVDRKFAATAPVWCEK